MSRRKNRPLADPNPLRVWMDSAPGVHTLQYLSDLTEALGQRLHQPTLSHYLSGSRVPTPRNAALIELATLGAVLRNSWYANAQDYKGTP